MRIIDLSFLSLRDVRHSESKTMNIWNLSVSHWDPTWSNPAWFPAVSQDMPRRLPPRSPHRAKWLCANGSNVFFPKKNIIWLYSMTICGGFLKRGYSKWSKIIPFEYWNPWFWGSPIFRNPRMTTSTWLLARHSGYFNCQIPPLLQQLGDGGIRSSESCDAPFHSMTWHHILRFTSLSLIHLHST